MAEGTPGADTDTPASRKPLLPDVGVVGLVPDIWGSEWMTRQHVLTRLAGYFQVVWLDPARDWRGLWLGREDTALAEETEGPDGPPGFSVYRPGRWLPRLYRPPVLAAYLAGRRVRNAVRILRAKGCRTVILYLWRPDFGFALDAAAHDLSCYHIDDEYSFSEIEQPVSPEEAVVIAQADQVIIHSPALMDKKGTLNPQTVMVPNGVEYDTFAQPLSEPWDMRTIPRPRMGYVGFIKKQLDLDLLCDLARRHREWSFVLVGPLGALGHEAAKIDELAGLENVYLPGGKPKAELPAYIRHMDVCIMPYKIDDYTKFIYPLKLHEYLASGRPVVASPIRSLLGFADAIRLARTADEWSQALGECLSEEELSPERTEARRRVAKEHDWDSLVHKIATVLSQRLGQRFYERFSSATGGRAVRPESKLRGP